MALKNLIDRFIDPKPTVVRAIDRYIARERKKERKRLERRRREIMKVARKVNSPELYGL